MSGQATIEPDDGSPSFNLGPGDAVYFMASFQCTWRVHEAPLVQRYGFFDLDGKEMKDAKSRELTLTRKHGETAKEKKLRH